MEEASTPSKKILLIFPHNLFLQNSGVKTRFYHLVSYLKDRDFTIDLLSLTNFEDNWTQEKINKQNLFDKIFLYDYKQPPGVPHNIRLLERLKARVVIALQPPPLPGLPDSAFPAMKELFKSIIKERKPDYVLMSYVHWATLVEGLDKNIQKILTIEDFITSNMFERQDGKLDIGQSIGEEIRRVNFFDKVICISKEEMSFFEKFCKKPSFFHIPHFLPPGNDSKPENLLYDLIYIGSNNPFNKAGMTWFFTEVHPLLPKRLKIAIIGGINEHLDAFKDRCTNVAFLPFVEKTDAYYSRSKIALCPIQGGTGLKVKVVEALSYGLPIVTTSQGTVGLEGDNNGCLVADNPEEFADKIKLLSSDQTLYEKISTEGYDYFLNHFEEKTVCKKLDAIFC